MKFSSDEMEGQLAMCHPDLLVVMRQFEVWSDGHGLPEPHISEVMRTPKEQGRIYAREWRDKALKTVRDPLTTALDKKHAQRLLDMPALELLALAAKKFTWHFVGAAVDIRTNHYRLAELTTVEKWFRDRCEPPIWELITEKHGTGAHIHLARRDYSWRKKMEAGNA